MTDWRAHVRQAVENADRDSLSADAVRAMRETVVAAARDREVEVTGPPWRRPLTLAATILLLIAVGITASRRMDGAFPASARPPIPGGAADSIAATAPRHRQLQFSTPGGTRIIWVFNSDLDLKAARP